MEELDAYRERFAKIKTDLTIIKWMRRPPRRVLLDRD
jgi:hypothetical protein